MKVYMEICTFSAFWRRLANFMEGRKDTLGTQYFY